MNWLFTLHKTLSRSLHVHVSPILNFSRTLNGSFHLILPISRTSSQEKSASNLSWKKCYSSQNLSVKYRYSPNLVSKKVLLQSKLIRKNMLLAQTYQEKNATQSFDRFDLIDLIDFRSSNMFCLTSFKLSSTFFLTRFGE